MVQAVAEQARRSSAHVVVDDLDSLQLADDDARHLQSALRLRSGELVGATDGRGSWRACRWSPADGLAPDGQALRLPPPRPPICVAFVPVKGDRNDWAVQKLTELGVDRIVVMRSERSVVRWDGVRLASHLDRLRRIARQAVMQSRGLWLPEVEGMVDFSEASAWPGAAVADPDGGPPSLARPTVLIGPEGGWSAAEMGRAGAAVSLGPGVLRTESAAVGAGVLLTALRAGLVAAAG